MAGYESLRQLLRQSHHARPEDLPGLAMRAAPLVGASSLVIYLVDHQQRQLCPMAGGTARDREPVPVDATLAGRAFATSEPCRSRDSDGTTRWWLPMLDGTERLGVLEAQTTGTDDVDELMAVASLLATLVASRSQYGDLIERIRRQDFMRLAAEMLRSQLPPLTFSTGHLIISGILEPCYDVGGDAFDYAVNGDIAHLALFDAVGHGSAGGMRAVILASLALAAYRGARRGGLDLIDTYHHIDKAVRAHDHTGMITAVLAELDQRTGQLRVISAGHPSGIVLRHGKLVKVLPTPTALPVTLGHQRPPVVVQESLEPGDQLLLYTDGIVEARSPAGELFGVDRLTEFATKALADQLPLPETARRLVHAILDHQDGRLQDDATILLTQWTTPAPADSAAEPVDVPDQRPLAPVHKDR